MLLRAGHRKRTKRTTIFMVRGKSNSMAADMDGWKLIEKEIYVSMTLRRLGFLYRDRGDERRFC
jgi:hypothetical protein